MQVGHTNKCSNILHFAFRLCKKVYEHIFEPHDEVLFGGHILFWYYFSTSRPVPAKGRVRYTMSMVSIAEPVHVACPYITVGLLVYMYINSVDCRLAVSRLYQDVFMPTSSNGNSNSCSIIFVYNRHYGWNMRTLSANSTVDNSNFWEINT